MDKNKEKKSKKALSKSNDTVNKLVLQVKNNNAEAFLELLGLFSHTVSSLAHSFSLPSSEHEDLCQEGRMALYRAAVSYDEKSNAQFSTYAITCMTNAMINFSKKYKAQNGTAVYGMSDSECEAVSQDSAIPIFELEELLSREGFAQLSAYERRVMSYKLGGYKVSEIAKLLEKPSKSVENTLFRARQKLKKHIDG